MAKKRWFSKKRTLFLVVCLGVILVAVIIAVAVAGWLAIRVPASPFDGAASAETSSPKLIQRGEYVARLGDCVACHSIPNSRAFTGGLKMATPLGSIYTTNITPERETGIGAYSLADFDRALRHGVAPGRHRLYPAMPYPSFAKLSDDDVRALYAYFMHAVPPVRQQNKPGNISSPWNARWLLALWNAFFTPSGTYQPKDAAVPGRISTLWNRGAYLVQGPGHCGGCHTPRGFAMHELALDESDPRYLSGALLDGWYAPSLRNDSNTGLGRWSEAEIIQFLKTGRNRHAVVFGSMTDAFNNSTQFMRDDDLKAIAHYLKSLPGDAERDGEPLEYKAAWIAAMPPSEWLKIPGAQTFMTQCSACHGQDGRGQSQWIPPLAGAASSLARENASSINVTLNGSTRVVADGIPSAYRMPAFRNQLSDQEIADVLTFVRTSWGNEGCAVKAKDVRALREQTNPASSNVIVLQMR